MSRPPPQRQHRLPFADVSDDSLLPIAPPIPAPYLRGAKITLPDELLAKMDGDKLPASELARMRRFVRVCKRRVRRRRSNFERDIGRLIESEEPWRP
jgi:hypothetical protein